MTLRQVIRRLTTHHLITHLLATTHRQATLIHRLRATPAPLRPRVLRRQ